MFPNFYISSLLLSALAGIAVYFQKNSPLYLKLIPIFLFLAFAIEEIGLWLANRGVHTLMLYNIFSTWEFVFYLWVLRQIIRNPGIRSAIGQLLWIYPLLAFLNIFFVQKDNFHTITYSIGVLLIVIICVYYFFELFRLEHSIKLVRQPSFWICSGLLFYYCCSYPFFAVANFWKNPSIRILQEIQFIISMMNVFLYLSFTIGFLCRIKIRNFILSSS
jgi:hypothetical protein